MSLSYRIIKNQEANGQQQENADRYDHAVGKPFSVLIRRKFKVVNIQNKLYATTDKCHQQYRR
jgi:hypothetical protein